MNETNKPTNLQEALALIPTHYLLTPGVDKWREGDEFLMTHDQWLKNSWEKAFAFKVVKNTEIGRRPILQEVRESMAWWLLYNTLANGEGSGARFIYEPDDKRWPLSTCLNLEVNGINGFGSREYLKSLKLIFGGESRIIKELSAGANPFERWLLSQGGET